MTPEDQAKADALAKLVVRHDELRAGHADLKEQVDSMSAQLDENTSITKASSETLHANAEAMQRLEEQFAGFLESLEILKAGIIVLGKIGNAGKWLTAKGVQVSRWFLPVGAVIAMIVKAYDYLHGRPPPP